MGRTPEEERRTAMAQAGEKEMRWIGVVRTACMNPETRALIRWLFREGGLHRNPYAASAEVYKNCGKLELVQQLRKLLKDALYETDRELFFDLTEG